MTLPPQIELRARCADADDLSAIIFEMQVTAGTKNPYTILFPKTTSDGCTVLPAAEVIGQFTDHWDMALMDYNGTLESAADIVTIRLFDPAPTREHYSSALAWPLFRHEGTRWQSRQQVLDYLLSCRNEEFTSAGISARLPESALLYMPLRKTIAHTNAV